MLSTSLMNENVSVPQTHSSGINFNFTINKECIRLIYYVTNPDTLSFLLSWVFIMVSFPWNLGFGDIG